MAKRDLYQEVTDKLIAAIENGASGDDWQRPWVGLQSGMPYNATTKHRYRGVNVLMLWCEASAKGYPTNEWASYKQWQARGAQVRAGERGTLIVYFGTTTKEREQPETGETVEEQLRFLKCSHVFNAAQVDGWQSPKVELPALAERLDAAERFVAGTGASIKFGGDRACYIPSADLICCPAWDAFKPTKHSTATENGYSTLLHELTHWTGAKGRCEREFGKRFGDKAYAAEELVAELGAAMLCAALGITSEPRADHAQYLANWLELLREDKKAIFTAAARASDAADYLHSLQSDQAETVAAVAA